jgi:hypothetical protein
MARGWESKGIEAQQEEAARRSRARPALSPEEKEALERRTSLELARTRARDDLSRASSPAHRRLLEATLHALERELGTLG